MPVVTAILPSPRKPERFELLADGRALGTLSLEAIERLELGVGRPLDERLLGEIEREKSLLGTYDRALNMLAMRARASAELRRQLLRKGEPAEQVDAAIERLQRAGFLDDAAFARQFTRSKALGAGMPRRRLRQELTRRGVGADVSDDAIDDVYDEERIDDAASIERVAGKKFRSLSQLDAPTRRRRLYAFLARRGYESDEIARVVRALVGEGEGE
jgi:regulatory protein